ncbi:UNVERIFIED_CONTAM: hypothetical protein GTU68_019221 [Idotea baltica]|nr:hypothetical protein [Idotea baltica]
MESTTHRKTILCFKRGWYRTSIL